ncbi:MAG: hypothetical protein FWG51_02100, partial [Firmicutes bacterium]|nr:hypothetical protein [Bacillota bacterium]
MKKIKFRKKFKKPIFLALGMFDCVHLAHTHIIDILYKLSKERNCLAAVFTFSDISNSSFKKDKTIYTFSERTERFLERNLDAVIYARATKRFLQMPPEKFLDSILQRYNILGIACGEDYTFGRDALGDINMLKDFCLKKNIELKIVNTILDDGIKI